MFYNQTGDSVSELKQVMENNKQISQGLEFINGIYNGYANYFFKKWKKTQKDEMFPVPLLYAAAFDDNEFTKGLYHYVRDLEVDMGCGCGEQFFLDVLVEEDLTLSSFKGLMLQLATDYINTELLNITETISSDELTDTV